MATARNPITGQLIKTKHNSSEYQTGYDRIFGNKKSPTPPPTEAPTQSN